MTRKLEKTASADQDIALLCGRSSDGQGVNILRQRGNTLETGILRPLQEGKQITGEVVQLRRRGNTPVCDVEVCYAAPAELAPARSSEPEKTSEATPAEATAVELSHPAQVANDSYRKNWDSIWKRSSSRKKYLN